MKSNKKVIFYDSFKIKSDRWIEDSFSYYSNGKYHMFPRSFTNDYMWISLQLSHSFHNFLYETEAEWVGGRKNSGYGLAFRARDTENAYVFSITKDGHYSLGILRNSKHKFIYKWKKSKLIQKYNTLGVACVNNCITAYINGKTVCNIIDSTYEKGYFGFFSSANIHTEFDNVKIYEIDEELLTLP